MTLQELLKQSGTIEVRTAPLLILIGAAVSTGKGPDIETIVEMLDPESEDE